MIIQCEHCQKRYNIDPEKIKGERARITCPACKGVIMVEKEAAGIDAPSTSDMPVFDVGPPPESPPLEVAPPGTTANPPLEEAPEPAPAPEPEPTAAPAPAAPVAAPVVRLKGMSLRTRHILTVVVPVLVAFALGGLISLIQMGRARDAMTTMAKERFSRMAEDMVAQQALAVADAVRLYIEARPEATLEDLYNVQDFRDMGIQPVGQTGYTAIYEKLPDGQVIVRIHPTMKDANLNKLRETTQKGPDYDSWWGVVQGPGEDEDIKGDYYKWKDADGVVRSQYMAMAKVKGTPLFVGATTYVDEFLDPVNKIANSILSANRTTLITIGIIIAITMLVVIGLDVLYTRRIVFTIMDLSRVADDISLGNLDATIDVSATGELGVLADSIARMQDSMKTAIERLRRRRRAT